MMNNTFKVVTVLSLILGIFSLIPSFLICALFQLEMTYAIFYTLIFCLADMILLPIPVYLMMKKEQRLMNTIKNNVGGKCFISKVALIDAQTGRGTNCFLCFNETKLLLVSKAGKLQEYLNLTKQELRSISVNENTYDMVISLVSNRSYRLFSPDPQTSKALLKAGWTVIEQKRNNF